MAETFSYTSAEWRDLRTAALRRDSGRCTVARLLGGECGGILHVHHIEPVETRPERALDLDNVATVCASHHPKWEAVRRAVLRARGYRRCRHWHPYPQGRVACERRLNRDRLPAEV